MLTYKVHKLGDLTTYPKDPPVKEALKLVYELCNSPKAL
jgi:hypothetical protein